MAADGGSAIFRAIADFVQLRREARKARDDLRDLGDESTQTSRKLGDTEKSSSSAGRGLSRLSSVLGTVHRRLGAIERSRTSGALRDIERAAGRVGSVLSSLRNKTVVFSFLAAGAAAAIGPIFGLIGAIVQLSGAAGLIPAAMGAAGAAIATIGIGLIGLKDAFKSASGGASGFASAAKAAERARITSAEAIRAAEQRLADARESAARRVKSAEQALTSAVKDAARARENLNRALEESVKDLRDLHLSLRGAELDERAAVLALARAQEHLAEVQKSGVGGLDLEEAKLGVDEAVQALEEAKVRYSDLREEAAKADAAGVNGAEKVVAAREQVAEADQAVADAQDELAQARKEGAREIADAEQELARAVRDAAWAQQDAAEQMASAAGKAGPALSAAAKDFVAAVKSLGPAFNDLRLDVQEKLFSGLGDKVRMLGKIYIPLLKTQLGTMATTFNGMAKDFADWLAQKSTVDDMGASLSNINGFWAEMRKAVKPLSQALLDIFKVGTEFLPEIGRSLADGAKKFADFIHQARESGKLKEWIGQGIQALKDLLAILGNVAGIFVAVFRAGQKEGNSLLQTLRDVTKSTKDYLNSAEGQEKLAAIFKAVKDAGKALQPVIKALFDGLVKVFPVFVHIAQVLAPGVADLITGIADAIKSAEPQLVGLGRALSGLFSAIGDASPIIAIIIKALAFAAAPLGVLADVLRLITRLFELLPKPMQDVITTVGGIGLAILVAVPLFLKLLSIGGKIIGVFKDAAQALLGTGKAAKIAAAEAAEASGATTVVAGGGSGDNKKKGAKPTGTTTGGRGRFGLLGALLGVAGIGEAFSMGEDAAEAFGKGAESKSEGIRKSIGAGLMGGAGVAAMFGPWGLVVAGALAAASLIVSNWEKVGPVLGKIWDGIKFGAGMIWGNIKSSIVDTTAGTASAVITGWQWLSSNVSSIAGSIWSGVTSTWDKIQTGVSNAQLAVGGAVSDGWQWISSTVSTGTANIWGTLSGWWDQVKLGWQGMSSAVSQTVSDGWHSVTSTVGEGKDWVLNKLGELGSWLGDRWSGFWSGASQRVSDFALGVGRIMSGLVDAIGTAVSKIGDFLGSLGRGVSNAAGWLGRNLNPSNWFSRGGRVPGTGDQDTVDAKLTPGEYVVPKKVAKKWLPLLRAINPYDQGGSPLDLQAMASGLLNNVAGGDGVAAQVMSGAQLAGLATPGAGMVNNQVSITNVINNPKPERASTSIHREAQKLRLHGILALSDTTDRSRR